MPSFYFEQLLQNGLNGIDRQGITAAVLQIASVVLVLSLLWGVYEAYCNGGDVRVLGVTAVKYLVLGLIFVNYQSAFRAVNSMFNGVADGVYKLSGGLDVIQSWNNSLSQVWQNNPNWFSALWSWVTGGASAILSGLVSVVGYLLLPVTYTLFALFYAVYGAILYVVGPFVLALMPSRSLGQLGRSFLTNMMVFQCWGLLYAIFQALMSALQVTNPNQFGNSFLQAFVGSSQVVLMSVASVLLSIMIALIPFIASRIVRGDIGSTLMTVVSGAVTAGAVASGLALSAREGAARGRMLASDGPPPPPAGSNGSAVGTSALAHNPSATGTATIAAPGAPPALSAGAASVAEAGTGSVASSDSAALRNPSTGQVFSWNGSGWQDAGHVAATDNASTSTYGSTSWRGGNGYSPRGYRGHSIAGFAAWQAGHVAGRTMRWIGMGKES